jgi:hypothetical protein
MSTFVMRPALVEPANLVATTATEVHPAYNLATVYAAGAWVRVDADKRIYKSLQDGNVGKPPSSEPLWWVDGGPSNAWAMFDNQISTATTATGTLSVTLAVGYANGLGLFGLVGDSLTVVVTDGPGGEEVYRHTQSLDGTLITDGYQYFFEPFDPLDRVFLSDLPPYLAAHVTMTVTGTGTVACGYFSLGTTYNIGDALFGFRSSIDDFSTVKTKNGVTTYEDGVSDGTRSVALKVDAQQVPKVSRLLKKLRGTPCVWVPSLSPQYLHLITLAVYAGTEDVIENAQTSLLSITLKDLV